MIQRVNSMATRVRLHLFQSSTNASLVSPVSDRSVAHRIVRSCNCSKAVRKMDTVEQLIRSIKMEQNKNKTLTL